MSRRQNANMNVSDMLPEPSFLKNTKNSKIINGEQKSRVETERESVPTWCYGACHMNLHDLII